METVCYRPIGLIHSPFRTPQGVPIQPSFAEGIPGTVEVEETYSEGLADLTGFSHIILLYHFHLSTGYSLRVVPFLDKTLRGVFATRAPRRPNALGLSIVRLERIEGAVLHVLDVDMVDGTPLLDIKPYVPKFDVRPDARAGWLKGSDERGLFPHADDRFSDGQT